MEEKRDLRWRWLGVGLSVVSLLGALLGLVVAGDLAAHPQRAIAWLAMALAAAAALCFVLRLRPGPSIREIVLLAALARLPLLALEPTLSEDVWRYLWEGRVLAAGHNPYLQPPAAEALSALRTGAFGAIAARVGHAEIPAVYPPGAMALFALAASTARPLLLWKIVVLAADLLACAALVALARRAGRPTWRVGLYAFNPLVLVEGVGSGHLDGVGVLPLAVAMLLLDRRALRGAAGAALAFAAAVLVKLLPLVALPALARHAKRRGAWLATAALACALGLAPMVWLARGVPPGLVTYGVSWEWNGPLFEPWWRLLDVVQLDHAVKAGLEQVERWLGNETALAPVFPWIYPQLLAKLSLAACLPLVVWWSLRASGPLEGLRRALAGSVCLLATVYPWYLSWLLPWAALERSLPWLVLSVTAWFSYLPLLFDLPVYPHAYLLVWGPPALVGAWCHGWPPGWRWWRRARPAMLPSRART